MTHPGLSERYGLMLCLALFMALSVFAANVSAGVNDDLLSAAESGNVKAASRLLAAGADINTRDQNGDTPFHAAARAGLLNIEDRLKAKTAEIDARRKGGVSPLQAALRKRKALTKGHKEVARLLIRKGADVNAKG
ncbi:MAG: ankyrin repeat domain-containing protein, partial [Gallionella sp.]|nr:ankyrin repeat domain-containing protein [Gallionella sp.]